MKTFNEYILVEKALTKKIKDILISKAKKRYKDISPCSGKTMDQCFILNKDKDEFMLFFNDPSGSTRLVMESVD
jgi:hypothetical protein